MTQYDSKSLKIRQNNSQQLKGCETELKQIKVVKVIHQMSIRLKGEWLEYYLFIKSKIGAMGIEVSDSQTVKFMLNQLKTVLDEQVLLPTLTLKELDQKITMITLKIQDLESIIVQNELGN